MKVIIENAETKERQEHEISKQMAELCFESAKRLLERGAAERWTFEQLQFELHELQPNPILRAVTMDAMNYIMKVSILEGMATLFQEILNS